MSTPEVSVLMSVYNGARYLRAAIESVLSQQGVDFELLAVNDGSTDKSGSILDEYAARDPSVRVIHQENLGLTRALIRGCNEARGRFIARQDADDVSRRLGGWPVWPISGVVTNDSLSFRLTCM